MSPVGTILRRELGTQFRSVLAYVFLVLFLLAAEVLYMLVVFPQGKADMQFFFDMLPWIVVPFAALVTMRSWAEERQENTYEMLLTFPMRDRQLVVAKWLAAFIFLAIGILGTLSIPIMLMNVGHPDKGAMLSGYLGALFFAATSAAAGVFFSGLTRSQLLAALLTLMTGLLSLFVGTGTSALLLDGFVPHVGLFLHATLGSWDHYSVFTRGVVELADVIFFAAWTVVFLHVNTLYIALRRGSGTAEPIAIAALLGLGCGMLASSLASGSSLGRVDLTDDKIYTLSPGTLAILAEASVPVQVRYYVSPSDQMPTQYKSLEREVSDRMREIEVASHGKLRFSVQHFNSANISLTEEEMSALEEEDADKEKAPEDGKAGDGAEAAKTPEQKKAAEARKRIREKEKSPENVAYAKGVRPYSVQSVEATQTSIMRVYTTLGVAYREKDEELIAPVVPERMGQLEYLFANVVAKLVRAHPPKIALVTGEEPMDPQMRMFMQQRGQKIPDPFENLPQLLRQEKYDVEKVALTAQQPLPEDYDALLVIGPNGLDERQKWEISRAMAEGHPTLIAAQRLRWDYKTERGIVVTPQPTEPGLDDVLGANGVSISRDVLMDESHRALTFQTGRGVFGMQTIDLPLHVVVTKEGMNRESPITQRLSSIFYFWGSALELDNAKVSGNDLKPTKLLSSSEHSWLVPVPSRGLRQQDIEPAGKEMKPRLLAVMLEGQLKDAYAGKPRPAWSPHLEMDPSGRPMPPMPDKPETPAKPAKGRLIVIGCSQLWSDSFLTADGDPMLLLNCIDAMTLDESLLEVRSKQPTDRKFEKPASWTAVLWTAIPLVLVPLTIIGIGVGIAVLRARRRESWDAAHGRWRS